MNRPRFFSVTSVLNIETWQQWCNAIKSVQITQSLNGESTLAKRGTERQSPTNVEDCLPSSCSKCSIFILFLKKFCAQFSSTQQGSTSWH